MYHKEKKLKKITITESGKKTSLPSAQIWDKTEVSSLFSKPPEQNTILSCRYETINTSTPLPSRDTNLPLEFRIPTTDEMIDPSHIMMSCRFKLIKLNDDNTVGTFTDTEYVAPVNFFLHTQFRHVECTMNNVNMNVNSNYHHAYISYLFGLLQFNDKQKKSFLTQAGWYADKTGFFDTFTGAADNNFPNPGFQKRYEMVNTNNVRGETELRGQIQLEIFKHAKLILSGVNIFLRFHRAEPTFSLVTANPGKYKIEITRAEIEIKRVRLEPERLSSLEATLSTRAATYNYVRYDTKTFPIAKFTTHAHFNLWSGILPSRLFIIHLSAKSYNGSYDSNPFNFNFRNLKSFSLLYNSIPLNGITHSLEVPYTSHFYTHNLMSMINFPGLQNLPKDDLFGGYGIIMQDLTPDLSAGAVHVSRRLVGNLDIQLEYPSTGTDESLILFVVGEVEDAYAIAKDRSVVAGTSNVQVST